MKARTNPFVAREASPWLIAGVFVTGAVWHFLSPIYALLPLAVLAWLLLIFRDPVRVTPAVPLGVVSPVDGRVVDVALAADSALNGEVHRITIRVNSLGTYTARCPVEGQIRDFRNAVPEENSNFNGLWVSTDNGDDVVLQFHGHRFGLAPRAFIGYGERVGQGQRCAYLRLTRLAEVQLTANGRVLVKPGQKVAAGIDLLARLPHP